MTKSLGLPILFIIFAVLVFFWNLQPWYGKMQDLRAQEAQYNEALDRMKELQDLREGLLSKYNSFSDRELASLHKILPDNVDSIRLILEFERIAEDNRVSIMNVVTRPQSEMQPTLAEAGVTSIGNLTMNVSVIGGYENIKNFLKDVESSLKVLDVVSVSLSASEGSAINYEANLEVRTYWLR